MTHYTKESIKYDKKLQEVREAIRVVLHSKRRLGNKLVALMDIAADMRDWTYEKTKDAYRNRNSI